MHAGPFWGKNCVYDKKEHVIAISTTNHLKFSKISFTANNAVINDDTPAHLTPFEFPVTACTLSADGSWLLAATQLTFQFFNIYDQNFVEFQPRNSHSAAISQCCFFPGDNNLLISASLDKTVKIWATEKTDCIKTLEANNPVLCVAITQDARTIVAGTSAGDIYIWRKTDDCWDLGLPEVKVQFQKHQAQINCLVFSPDGTKMVSTASDRTLILWNTSNWTIIHHLKDITTINCCVFSGDGQFLFMGGEDGSVKSWHFSQGLFVSKIGVHREPITDCFFSEAHNVVVARTRTNNDVKCWTVVPAVIGFSHYSLEVIGTLVRSQRSSPVNTPFSSGGLENSSVLVSALMLAPTPARAPLHLSAHYSGILTLPPLSEPRTPPRTTGATDSLPLLSPIFGGGAASTVSAASSPLKQLHLQHSAPSSQAPSPRGYVGHDPSLASLHLLNPSATPKKELFPERASAAATPAPTADDIVASIIQPKSETVRALREFADTTFSNGTHLEAFLLNNRQAGNNTLLNATVLTLLEADLPAGGESALARQITAIKQIPNAHNGQSIPTSASSIYLSKSIFGKITTIYMLSSGGNNGDVRRWNLDITRLTPVKKMTGHRAAIQCCSISPDGKLIVSSDTRGIVRIRPSTGLNPCGIFTKEWQAPAPINNSLFISDNQNLLFTTSIPINDEYPIVNFNIAAKGITFLLKGHTNIITGISWITPAVLMSSSLDSTIRLWDLNTNTCLKVFELGFNISKSAATYTQIDYSGRGGDEVGYPILIFACVQENSPTIKIFSPSTKSVIHELKTYRKNVTCCAFLNNGLLFFSGHENGAIVIWDVKTGQLLGVKNEHTSAVQSISISADDRYIISTATNGFVIIWDTGLRSVAERLLPTDQAFDS